VQSYSVAKIISHETLHQVIKIIAGEEASWKLDNILQKREYHLDKYIQHDKIEIMPAD